MIKDRILLFFVVTTLFLGVHCVLNAQPGRDLEFKGDHPMYHFSDSTYYPGNDVSQYLVFTMDSIPPEDRVYVTYDTIVGFLVNGHPSSVYELPSIIRYALTNPAGKAYLPQNNATATVMFLYDFPFLEVTPLRDYRTAIGMQFITSTVFNVLYDIWNEDARYAEDKVFAHLSERQKKQVVARNPHRIQWLNFSDELMGISGPGGTLDPLSDDQEYEEPLEPRNLISINVGEGEYLQFCEEEIRLEDLEGRLHDRMTNPDQLEDWPEGLDRVVIQLRNQRGTSYEFYLEVYNTIKDFYYQLWEAKAKELYDRSYEDLETEEKRSIRTEIPMVISEAEPISFGED